MCCEITRNKNHTLGLKLCCQGWMTYCGSWLGVTGFEVDAGVVTAGVGETGEGVLPATGIATSFQSSPSPTISAINDPTFTSLVPSGTC